MSHGSSHGHSGVANRGGINVVGNPGFSSSTNAVGGSIPGILSTSAAIGNRNAVPGLGVSPILGNAGTRITSSMGNMVSGGNIGRSITSGGGLSLPGLASRLNISANSGSGSLTVQGQNRLMGGVLPQGTVPWLSVWVLIFMYTVQRLSNIISLYLVLWSLLSGRYVDVSYSNGVNLYKWISDSVTAEQLFLSCII